MDKDLVRYLKFLGNFLSKTFNINNLSFSIRCPCPEEISTPVLSNELHWDSAKRVGHGKKTGNGRYQY